MTLHIQQVNADGTPVTATEIIGGVATAVEGVIAAETGSPVTAALDAVETVAPNLVTKVETEVEKVVQEITPAAIGSVISGTTTAVGETVTKVEDTVGKIESDVSSVEKTVATIKSDTDEVKKVVDTVKTTGEDFATKLEDAAKLVRLKGLGIADFPKEVQDHLLDIIDTGSAQARDFILHTLDYLKVMGPNSPVTEKTGGDHQVRFFSELVSAIENTVGTDFRKMMSGFLAIVHNSKDNGAFAGNLINRFLPTVNLGAEARKTFQYLMGMFRTLSGVEGRSVAMKQVDLNTATKGLSEDAAQKLKNFFRV